MKPTLARGRATAVRPVDPQNTRFYQAVILLISLTAGGAAIGQTTNAPPAASTSDSGSGTNVVKLAPTTVVGKLDVAREQIVPDRKSTRLNSSHSSISYAVFCLKKQIPQEQLDQQPPYTQR